MHRALFVCGMIHRMMAGQGKTSQYKWKVKKRQIWSTGFWILGLLLSACQPANPTLTGIGIPQGIPSSAGSTPLEMGGAAAETITAQITPLPTRPAFSPGELVEYVTQTGDTLPALAARFNTTVDEILLANTFIPSSATTMPFGMPMQIPIYYLPFWGSQYKILPDSLFINGPAQVGFDTASFLASQPGWFSRYYEYAFGGNRSGAEIVDYVALNFSVSPRLLLALLDYQAGALSQPLQPTELGSYIMGKSDYRYRGVYMQLVWVANVLNNGYYVYRAGTLTEFERLDGRIERIDPWQNAASASLQYYFSTFLDGEAYLRAIAYDGLAQTYQTYFGDPWQMEVPHLPGSLTQPEFTLPFVSGLTWAFTGGPHTGYGTDAPFAALDFAPGASSGGCVPTDEWTTAVAPGVVVRSEPGIVVLDLDMDGDEHTGWTVFYFHIGTEGRAPLGAVLQTGNPIGHPSCEGGRTTGTHVHIARKYNGEWILADGVMPFNLEGWIAHNGSQAYQGTLIRGGRTVTACECSDASSQLEAGR
jgi:LasA protease